MNQLLKSVTMLVVSSIPLLSFCQQPAHYSNVIDTADRPQAFAPGIISTPFTEWSTSFTLDGSTVFSSRGSIYWTIIYSKKQNGVWQRPAVASFSGKYRDTDPFVSPDGKAIFYISNRPTPDMPQSKPQRAMHLWRVDRLSDGEWGKPQYIDSALNLKGIDNYAPSVSSKGTLFYCSRRKELTGMQSFYAVWTGDHYAAPQQLIIKGAEEIQDPFIAPDESYIVFLNGNDLCISFKDGCKWGEPQKLGPQVNDGNSNSSPYVSGDGKTLYYTSNRIQGFYKRTLANPPLNYEQLEAENNNPFNGSGNILMIPIHLPGKS